MRGIWEEMRLKKQIGKELGYFKKLIQQVIGNFLSILNRMLVLQNLKFKIMTPLLCEEYIRESMRGGEASEESGRARKLVYGLN